MSLPARITLGFLAFLAAAACAFLLPRVAAGNHTGFAASTNAAMAFLGGMAVATVIGIGLLIVTIRNRGQLPRGTRFIGYLPLPLLAATVAVVVVVAIQRQGARQDDDPSPRTPAPVTTPPP